MVNKMRSVKEVKGSFLHLSDDVQRKACEKSNGKLTVKARSWHKASFKGIETVFNVETGEVTDNFDKQRWTGLNGKDKNKENCKVQSAKWRDMK